MTSKKDPKVQSYSAQIRASQNDPGVNTDYYNYQQQQQQKQQRQLQSVSPRASQDLHRSAGNNNGISYDHYPTSSSSSNSAATTFINLTSQNNSSQGLADNSQSDPPSSSSAAQIGHTSTSTPSPLGQHGSTHPTPSSSLSPGKRLSSFIRKKTHSHSKSQSQHSISSQSQGQYSSQQPAEPHKPGTTRSQLTARTSRSSLQLNLRTSQLFHGSPFVSSSATGGNVVGPLDEIYLQPAPVSEKDPQQHLSHRHSSCTNNDPTRNSVMTLAAQNRQDEGRDNLEQERAHVQSHKLTTWTKSKFLLLLANTLLLAYSVGCTVVMVMSWKGVKWTKPYLDSGIMIIANHKLLYLMMATAPFGIFVALVGYIGIFWQSRKVLTVYTILLWPLFALITSIGYLCYRRVHVRLYQKLKFSWINEYTRDDRLVIQNALSCCGYRSLGDYPSYDLHCFPRAPLPSCESLFLQYQQELLSNTSSAAFILLPVQLLVMLVALLCSNHIDHLYRTAHPITPKLYTQ